MVRFFAHCWLILSLLVAPVQFAAADVTLLDHGKCEMMTMTGHDMTTMDHDMTDMAKTGCECPDQCKTGCAGAHASLAVLTTVQVFQPVASSIPADMAQTRHGIAQRTEERPPRKLHA